MMLEVEGLRAEECSILQPTAHHDMTSSASAATSRIVRKESVSMEIMRPVYGGGGCDARQEAVRPYKEPLLWVYVVYIPGG